MRRTGAAIAGMTYHTPPGGTNAGRFDSSLLGIRPRLRVMPAVPAPAERPLWLTVPGASAAVPLGWALWLALAALAPSMVTAYLGCAGAMLAVVTVGWCLARSAPEPSEALRRYHLD